MNGTRMRRCGRRHVLIKHVILGDIAGRDAGIGSLEHLLRDYSVRTGLLRVRACLQSILGGERKPKLN